MTYSEWNPLYFALYKRKIKPKTRESYDRLNALLLPILGALELSAITPDHIQSALIRIEDLTGSRQSQLAFTLLRASLRRAVRSGHLAANPMDAVDKPEHHTEQGRAIKGEDWTRLYPAILDDMAFALAAFAGLRRGELLALRREDIDLDAGFIRIRRQLVRVKGQLIEQTPKSAAGQRDVWIMPELLPVLQSACRLLHPKTRLVSCAPETINHRWRRLQVEEGIAQPYRLHDLRHTYATRLIAAGCEMAAVQYSLGHSSIQLTLDTYSHVDGTDAAFAMQRIASLMR